MCIWRDELLAHNLIQTEKLFRLENIACLLCFFFGSRMWRTIWKFDVLTLQIVKKNREPTKRILQLTTQFQLTEDFNTNGF